MGSDVDDYGLKNNNGILLVCFVAYFLQWIGEPFAWLFVASLILLFWLIVAGLFAILEYFIYTDEL